MLGSCRVHVSCQILPTLHTTSNLEVFISLDKSVTSRVKLVDETTLKAQGKGVVKVNSFGTSCINDVLYTPDLGSSLLSVGQFLREGYSPLFEYFSCTIYKDKTKKNMLFKVPISRGNLFPFTLENDNKAASFTMEDDNWLWHHRYGHLNF